MADVHNQATRSYNMSRIKGKDTKPEMLVHRYLHAQGFRYRLHLKDLPGKPDIVLPKHKTGYFCTWFFDILTKSERFIDYCKPCQTIEEKNSTIR